MARASPRRRPSPPKRTAASPTGPAAGTARARCRTCRVSLVARLAEIADSFFTPAVNDLVPYEPGKPVEEVQRELGLERVVKLASNEGPFGPFPAAVEAIE